MYLTVFSILVQTRASCNLRTKYWLALPAFSVCMILFFCLVLFLLRVVFPPSAFKAVKINTLVLDRQGKPCLCPLYLRLPLLLSSSFTPSGSLPHTLSILSTLPPLWRCAWDALLPRWRLAVQNCQERQGERNRGRLRSNRREAGQQEEGDD